MPPPEGELNLFCEPLSSNDPKLVVVDVGGGPEPELTEKAPKLEVVDVGGGPEPELTEKAPKLEGVDVGGGPEPELTEKTPKLEVVDDGGGPEPELTEKTLFLLFSREEARLCLPLAPIETCELEPFYWIYRERLKLKINALVDASGLCSSIPGVCRKGTGWILPPH